MLKFRRFLKKSVNLFLCIAILINFSFVNRVYAEENVLNQEEISQNDEESEVIEENEDYSSTPESEEEPSSDDDFVIPPLTYRAPVFDEDTNFIHVKRSNGLLKASVSLPTKYDSRDVNGVNYITPVKNQNPFGTCWVFACTAAMEANYEKRHPGSQLDLSEYQMSWFTYDTYGISDPLGLMTKDGLAFMVEPSNGDFSYGTPYRVHGIDTFDAGGNAVNICNMISSGIGPWDEKEDRKYTDIEVVNNVVQNRDRYIEGGIYSFSEDECYDHDYILVNANCYEFGSISQNNLVKQAVMENAAVCISMYYDGNATSGTTASCYNSQHHAYYSPYDNRGVNHLVTIVGWDDNFDKNYFNKIKVNGEEYAPQNNGAWLIKNSWGPNWGDGGYFWISYEDKAIHKDKAYAFEIEREDKTNPYKIYGADGLIASNITLFSVAGADETNLAGEYFVPQANETIEKIGIYSTAADQIYTISIYKDMFATTDLFTEINLLTYLNLYDPDVSFETTLDYYGFHLVDVPEEVKVEKGKPYFVTISFVSTDGNKVGRFHLQGGSFKDYGPGQDFITGNRFYIEGKNKSENNCFIGKIASNGLKVLYANTNAGFQNLKDSDGNYTSFKDYDLKLKVYTKEPSTTSSYIVEHYTENLNGGYSKHNEEQFTGTIGSTVTASNISIDGFEYDSSNANNKTSGEILSDGSLVLKLYYSRKSYKISFNTDGGSTINDVTYKFGATITPPSNPTKTGYVFSKWEPEIPATMPSNPVSVKAIWDPVNVNVHILHYIQDASGTTYSKDSEETVQLLTDSSVTLSSKKKTTDKYKYYEYYKGVSYDAEPNDTIDTPTSFNETTTVLSGGNRYIVLLYKPKKYKLVLEKDNGIDKIEVNSGLNLSQYNYNQSIELKAFPKIGYKFYNWKKNGNTFDNNTNATYTFNMPGAEVKYKAFSTPIIYKINYDLDNGAFPVSQQPLTEVTYDSEFVVPVPEKENFTFTNWTITGLDNSTHVVGIETTNAETLTNVTANSFKNLTTVENNTITFKANYGPKQYSYTVQKYLMDTKGDYPSTPTSTDNGTGEYNSTIDYSGYTTPEGFTLDETKSVRPDKINSSELVVKLYYSRNKYSLSIAKSGDTNQTITGIGEHYYNQDVTVTVTPSVGYHFVSLKEGNSQLSTSSTYSFKMPAKTYSLTSVCAINTYTISYDLNYQGASNPSNSSVNYGSEIEISNPTRQYYTFTGWTITGLDNTTHVIGGQEKTGTSLNNITATKFKNLTASNGAVVNFKANWSANTINYTVNIYEMKADGNYPNSPTSTVSPSPSATYGSNVSYNPPSKTGFTVDNSKSLLSALLNSDSVVLSVYYKRNSHTITIESDNGVASVTGGGDHLFGTSVNLQATIKNGYKFSKWVVGGVDKTDESLSYEMGDSDVTIKLITTPIKYMITYNLNDGSFPSSQQPLTEVTYDSEFIVPNPQKEGYTFVGWTIIGLDSTTHIIGDQSLTSNSLSNITATKFMNLTSIENNTVTFTAEWAEAPIPYTINYYVQDTSGNYDLESEPYSTNQVLIARGGVATISPIEIEGFTFDSDKTGDNLSKTIDEEGIVFNLYYSRNKYKVILEKDDGIDTVVGECEDYFDKEVEISATANKGYSFLKWLRDNEDYAQDDTTTIKILAHETTYKAISKANTYNITYNLNGGVKGDNSPTFGTFGVDLMVPHPTKAGYDFIGWYVEGMDETIIHYLNNQEYDGVSYTEGDPIIGDTKTIFKNLHSELDAEVVLSANWQARTDTPYTIEHYLELSNGSYDTNPSKSESKTGTTDEEVSATSLEFVGYVYDSSSTSTGIVQGDGSLKIKLYYKRKSYKVVFDGNGADSGNMSEISVFFNSGIIMPDNKFVKNNNVFVGWQVEGDDENIKCMGDNQYIVSEEFINKYSIDDTITIKAIWENNVEISIDIPGTIADGQANNLTKKSDNLFETTLTNNNIKEVLYPSSAISSVHSTVTWIEALACSQSKVLQIASALRSKGINYKNIYCVEINLFMADDGDSSSGKKVTSTYSPVNLQLDISSNQELVDAAKSDLVVVYSVHEGQLQDEIKGTFNKDTNEYSFSTSKFSTYALCALQPATPASDPGDNNNYHINPEFSVPDTGIKR